MNLIISGAPGAGKGTQAQSLREYWNIPYISSGNMIREAISVSIKAGFETGIIAKTYINSEKSIPREIVKKMLKEIGWEGSFKNRILLTDQNKGFILDGQKTVKDAEYMRSLLESINVNIDVIINILVPYEVLVSRLSNRRICSSFECNSVYSLQFKPPVKKDVCDYCGSFLLLRGDDELGNVCKRLDSYEENAIQIYKSKHFYCIDGDKPADLLQADIVTIVENSIAFPMRTL